MTAGEALPPLLGTLKRTRSLPPPRPSRKRIALHAVPPRPRVSRKRTALHAVQLSPRVSPQRVALPVRSPRGGFGGS